MYLRQVYIENNGPIAQLSLDLPEDRPTPIVLVGGNGSGKTTLLSLVTDALFEAATTHFTDIVPGQSALTRPWFRVVGGVTVKAGAQGGCSILEFHHGGTRHLYREKGGTLLASEVRERAPEALRAAAAWADQGADKGFDIPSDVAKQVFEKGVYAYFPSSRAEVPHWLNQGSLHTDEHATRQRFDSQLGKPIYVEKGLNSFRQWLLSLLIDIRVDFGMVQGQVGELPVILGNVPFARSQRAIWELANKVLRIIIGDEEAGFVWMGRWSPGGVGVRHRGAVLPIETLSAGQSTLLSIFGTILRYGDQQGAPVDLEIEGICVVDEIDAHMHVDLQYRALPQLIALFPRVQFVTSSHSPLFVLGMEKAFGEGGVLIVDMPSGRAIESEAYAEFGKALEVMQDTKAFNSALATLVEAGGQMLVLVEGETDPQYLVAAAQLLGLQQLLERIEFSWIGAKDPKNGQGFHTGKDALNDTLNFLRAKPDLVKRPIVLLYDNDARKTDFDEGNLHVRSMPTNQANDVVRAGIENLLPVASITADFFDEKVSNKGNGTVVTTNTLNKSRLCSHLCAKKRDPADFEGFRALLQCLDDMSQAD